jgi:hypothetical protein
MPANEQTADSARGRRLWRRLVALFVLFFCLPALASAASMIGGERKHWSTARRDSAGIAPDAASTAEGVLQVYAARTWGWRGAFGVHTWIAAKPTGADHYVRYEVIGWYAYRGGSAVSVRRGIPDAYWYGSRPEVIAEFRGPEVDELIAKIDRAVESYPYPDEYTVYPGPNSNTFIAHIGREVPELRLDLPPTAVGKDYLNNGAIAARSPSGTGFQVSLFGLLGVTAGIEEGFELNFFGLVLGVDVKDPALKLPGIGRLGTKRPAGGPARPRRRRPSGPLP